MSEIEEVTLIYRGESMRWDGGDQPDTVLLLAEKPPSTGDQYKLFDQTQYIVKVKADEGDFKFNFAYRFYGRWTTYRNRHSSEITRQFHAESFIETHPHGKRGVIAYLKRIPGIGVKIAEKLWTRFEGDAVSALRESPEIIGPTIGITDAKAVAASEFLKLCSATEDCDIDLMGVLASRGFPKGTLKNAKLKWGNFAATAIRKNPFRLLRWSGCGFLRCDQMYLDLGNDPFWIGRQVFAGLYTIQQDSSGSTWFPSEFWANGGGGGRGVRRLVGGTDLDVERSLRIAIRSGWVCERRCNDGSMGIAVRAAATSEETLALCISSMGLYGGSRWPDVEKLDISDHQKEELAVATSKQIGVFCGSPGTGKTYTSARMIRALIEENGIESVAVVAFTNKAAHRLNESMALYDVPAIATTIHKLLGPSKTASGWTFEHNRNNPLDIKFLIIDEMSMNGTGLTSSLFEALRVRCHVLMLGDINQLPPVEHGAPLRDIIAAGIPTGSLVEIQRNSGAIVEACASIRDGFKFETTPIDIANGRNFCLLPERGDVAAVANRVAMAVHNLRKNNFVDPINRIQVICATNNLRHQLNTLIQPIVNPRGQGCPGSPFWVGDRVVSRENGGMDALDDDEPVFVTKGETGIVVATKPTLVTISFPQGVVKMPFKISGEGPHSLRCELAYAMTCHYMQGSEAPVTMIALDPGHGAGMVTGKEWLITAISRAKEVCFLVGNPTVAKLMCNVERLSTRLTYLTESIQEGFGDGEKDCKEEEERPPADVRELPLLNRSEWDEDMPPIPANLD